MVEIMKKENILGLSDSWEKPANPEKNGYRKFENAQTGEQLIYHAGKSGRIGHQGHDHYHRLNPDKTNWKDEYLDGSGNTVPDGHDHAHIYHPDKVWWNQIENKVVFDNYLPLFHDGAVFNIEHINSNMTIFMRSAQVHKEDLKHKIELSKYDRIKGKLHLEKIKMILINGLPFSGTLKMFGDKGGIFDFLLTNNMVELQMEWVNYPPKQPINEFSTIRIEAGQIWWENIPDLCDPFW